MLPLDTDTSRQLARERQADLKRDWQWVNPAGPDVVETRRRHWQFKLDWLRTHLHLRPAGHAS
jgi:hypothetical protein